MYWFLLVLCSIPVYLVIAFAVFETGENAKETFGGTLVALLKIIFIPPLVRALLGMDDDDAYGIFPIALFFSGCVAITYVEHLLLQRFLA